MIKNYSFCKNDQSTSIELSWEINSRLLKYVFFVSKTKSKIQKAIYFSNYRLIFFILMRRTWWMHIKNVISNLTFFIRLS